jgi:hypothetical protein
VKAGGEMAKRRARGQTVKRRPANLTPEDERFLQEYAVAYWRPMRQGEPATADQDAIEFDRFWRETFGVSILELLDVADAATPARWRAAHGRAALANRLAPMLARWRAALRRELNRPALPGSSSTIEELVEQENTLRSRHGTLRIAGTGHDSHLADPVAVAHKLIALFDSILDQSGLSVRSQAPRGGTRAADVELGRAADAADRWITERRGRPDHRLVVRALEFFGWDLGANPLAYKKNRIRQLLLRHRGTAARDPARVRISRVPSR